MADNMQGRTTLTGKPITYQHDTLTNTMHPNFTNAGANLLPPGFTDTSLVHIPIKLSDLGDDTEKPIAAPPKKGFFAKKFGGGGSSSSKQDIKVVSMSRGDYLKYWAKGDDGQFLPSVDEPPEGRREWFDNQLELNEDWKKQGIS